MTAGPRVLLGLALRANPAYELVLFDRLPAAEQSALAELAGDPGFYGVLRPAAPGTGGSLKSVDRDTALLFLTLREAGSLPSYVRALLGEGTERMVSRLVADGILEIEAEAGGDAFVTGAAALARLAEPGGEPGEGRIAALSAAALRYGQALPVDDPALLAWRLYSYNRQPLTPAWRRLLPDAAAVERWLGIDRGGAHRRFLDSAWTPSGMDGWLGWWARPRAGGTPERAGGPTWKLYVSPQPEALAGCFGDVLAALAASRASQFKIGRDAGGLLRPDKIVAYFPSWERLAGAADAVLERLAGAPAQGVPFTAEIGGAGLLSWGVDPPDEARSILGGGRESWRVWVAHRLAWALLAARQAGQGDDGAAGLEPWRFALERVRLEGVDTASWTPGAALWKDA
jgi:hypothetical protein